MVVEVLVPLGRHLGVEAAEPDHEAPHVEEGDLGPAVESRGEAEFLQSVRIASKSVRAQQKHTLVPPALSDTHILILVVLRDLFLLVRGLGYGVLSNASALLNQQLARAVRDVGFREFGSGTPYLRSHGLSRVALVSDTRPLLCFGKQAISQWLCW